MAAVRVTPRTLDRPVVAASIPSIRVGSAEFM